MLEIATIAALLVSWAIFLWPKRKQPIVVNPAPVAIDFRPLQAAIDGLPNKVLQSIQGSSNVQKGALGELIGFIQLRSEYDRIIPLGNIADFLCIKFSKSSPSGIIPGIVEFIDIKTGNARLSSDQKELQKLIEDKLIKFTKLKIESI